MPNARHSKASNDIKNIRQQLKSGQTRGGNPHDLTPEETERLEKRRDELAAQIKEQHKERGIARVNKHTTVEADRVIMTLQQDGDATRAALQPMNAVIAGDTSTSTEERVKSRKKQIALLQSGNREDLVMKNKEQAEAKAAKIQGREDAKAAKIQEREAAKTAKAKRGAAPRSQRGATQSTRSSASVKKRGRDQLDVTADEELMDEEEGEEPVVGEAASSSGVGVADRSVPAADVEPEATSIDAVIEEVVADDAATDGDAAKDAVVKGVVVEEAIVAYAVVKDAVETFVWPVGGYKHDKHGIDIEPMVAGVRYRLTQPTALYQVIDKRELDTYTAGEHGCYFYDLSKDTVYFDSPAYCKWEVSVLSFLTRRYSSV